MGWYRIKKRVKGKPDAELYEKKKEELKELDNLEKEGKIDLYYVDESGFRRTRVLRCPQHREMSVLMPYLPYARMRERRENQSRK